MGKSPGKWIKTVLFGKKSSKHHISKGREKCANEREVVIATKASGADFASVPPAASHPFPTSTERNERKLELETKQAGDIHGADEILLEGNRNAETQGSTPEGAPIDPEIIRKEQAATIVQATFRGYLARRAFWALKGIIRLQALIRGHLVRRQAVATLCSMLGIVKFQALIRGKRVRASDIGIEVQSKCSLVFSQDGKHVEPVNISTQMAKLSTNAFILKLLAPSPNATPLYVHYESGEPNSAASWLERWSSTHFWKPVPQPKKIPDVKSQKKHANGPVSEPHASRSKRTRRPHSTNAETVPAPPTSEFEKPKRTFRKASSHVAEPVQENPQVELEKVKRNLRKVHNPVVENASSEAEPEPKQSVEKELTSSGHDSSEQYVSNATEKTKKESASSEKAKKEAASSERVKKDTTTIEKVKKEPIPSEMVKRETPSHEKVKKEITSNEKAKKEPATVLPEVEAVPEPTVTKDTSDVFGDQPIVDEKPPTDSPRNDEAVQRDQVAVESLPLTDSDVKQENSSATNGELGQKEDLTATENGKSGRKASTPAKQERSENGLQSSPALPSYMAATESAKAKLRAQGSPKLAPEATEKSNPNRRHSLPSSTNSKVSSQSPRTQRPAQSGGKPGNKSDRTLSSRDGNGKVNQAEWRR